jgi:hypothetical protein
MAAGRLDETQKQELVARYQAGEASTALAEAFGCSPNTVSRTVRAALSPEAYEKLKQQRAKGVLAGSLAAAEPEAKAKPAEVTVEEAEEEVEPDEVEVAAEEAPAAVVPAPAVAAPLAPEAEPITPASLALDDADDFGDDEFGDDQFGDDDSENSFVALPPVTVQANLDGGSNCESKPLRADQLPASLYLLVDREVELKGTPVKDFSELGPLAPGEEQLQAIALFSNPRQAKRQCGRSQRVIKLPDPTLLERTAPYILAQGISRIVLEGSLYAIPGSPSPG